MNNFIHFKDIVVEKPETWKGKKILSLDIDWASDEILNFTLDLIETKNIKACFFVTHQTKVLERIKQNPLFELGIHPNFNPLLDGDKNSKSASQIIDDLLEIVPNSKILRSHSMTTSGKWLGLYKQKGITHLSNYLQYGLEPVVPFKQINGLIETPVYFADDGYVYLNDTKEMENPALESIKESNEHGVKVYNFHPVHLWLNTNNFHDYQKYRDSKVKVPNNSNGVTNILELISFQKD